MQGIYTYIPETNHATRDYYYYYHHHHHLLLLLL
jgi:hypothetical protein